MNPFLFWVLAFHDIFDELVEHMELLEEEEDTKKILVIPGSVEEAYTYMQSECGLV